MRSARVGLFLAAGLATAAYAQTPATPALQALRIRALNQDIAVDAQGRAVTTTHNEIQILSAGAIAQGSQVPLTYNATLQQAEIVDAYTLKADGRKVAVDAGNVMTQKAPGAAALAPIYNDSEQKIIIFPNVEAGDTLVYTARITDKEPLLSGQFMTARAFNTSVEADQARFSLTVPKTMAMNVDSRDMNEETSRQGDNNVWRWSYSNQTAKARPAALVSDPNSELHFAASSFKDYDAFAHDMAARIKGKITVSDAIAKQADQITAGITDPRAQARALYDWVNEHVRYVAITLGVGGYIPHDADWTLNNAFGDCKDQAVLYASLLKAKNIAAELVVINATNRYTLGRVPSPGDFNHVIVWLPAFHLYADTTVAGIPFGLLPAPDYAKPVLHLVESGPARHDTPAIAAGMLTSNYTLRATMNAQRGFDGEVSISATGPWAGTLRKLGGDIQRAGPVPAAKALLTLHRFTTATGTLAPSPKNAPAADADTAYTIDGTFHTGALNTEGNVFALANIMRLVDGAGEGPMGPLANTTATENDDTPCYNARQTEDITVTLLQGTHLAQVPADKHVKTDNLTYDAHWTVNGDTVSVHREFVSRVDSPVCTGTVRRNAYIALGQIRADYAVGTRLGRSLSLPPPPSLGQGPATGTPPPTR